MSSLPTPDDLLHRGLLLLFGPGIVVALFGMLNVVLSWFGFARASMRTGRTIARGVRTATAHARHLTVRSAFAALFALIVIICLQAVWASLGYYIGNSVRIFVQGVAGTLQAPPHLDVRTIPQLLHSDAYSNGAIGASVAAGVVSWVRLSSRRGSVDGLVGLMSAPGYVWGFFGLVGGALNAITVGTGMEKEIDWYGVTYMLAFGVSGSLYVIATRLALNSPRWLRFAPEGSSR